MSQTQVVPHTAPRRQIELGGREFVVLVATCMGMAAISIDLMLPAFDEMRAEFDLADDSTSISWLITAFFLGLAAGQVFYGPLSDRFGRKPLLYAGLVIYVLSGAAASFMPNLPALVVCRVLWGFGAAAPRSLALTMVRDVFEGDRMARTMSMVMATFLVVPIVAPGLGALAMAVAPWRIVFWVPVVAVGLLALWLRRMPETLPPERRRSVAPSALLEAFKVVVHTRDTVAYGIVLTCVFAMMTSYLAGSEIILDEVYGRADIFPVVFGVLALALAAGSLLSARLVMQVGLHRLVRLATLYLVATTGCGAVLAALTGGDPPLWAFCVVVALFLPAVSVINANGNTAAMLPVPHVAGMAAAVLGTLATAIGALLGSIVDGRFDGTVRPFLFSALLFAVIALASVLGLARRPLPPARPAVATSARTARPAGRAPARAGPEGHAPT